MLFSHLLALLRHKRGLCASDARLLPRTQRRMPKLASTAFGLAPSTADTEPGGQGLHLPPATSAYEPRAHNFKKVGLMRMDFHYKITFL